MRTNFIHAPFFQDSRPRSIVNGKKIMCKKSSSTKPSCYDTYLHGDQHYRVYYVVDQYANPIIQYKKDEHPTVDIWFVIIPDEVYRFCRPNSVVPADLITDKKRLTEKFAKEYISDASLFSDITSEVEPYRFEVNLREQLSTRLPRHQIPTKISGEYDKPRMIFSINLDSIENVNQHFRLLEVFPRQLSIRPVAGLGS